MVEHQGQRYLHLRDPLGLSDKTVLVPQQVAPLLALCDGTRDVEALKAAMALRTGVQLTESQIGELLAGLESVYAFENGAFQQASADALRSYREATHRKPSHADLVYPADPDELRTTLDDYVARARGDGKAAPEGSVSKQPDPTPARSPTARLTGVVSPHIDFERGWQTYAQLWDGCKPELEEIDLAIIIGTDHSGGLGAITPTRQSYATPYGVLPTAVEIVDGLADALGIENAFREELHHVNEHSIELAAVWFHHFLGGRNCPVVGVLCGSYQHFVSGEANAAEDEGIGAAAAYLSGVAAGRRALVIAAADLAHVGPAFGDPAAIDPVGRADVAARDAKSVSAICDGDAAGFLALSTAEGDSRKICGLPPIYLALRVLGDAVGESVGYAQCHADSNGGSLVSIAAVRLYER